MVLAGRGKRYRLRLAEIFDHLVFSGADLVWFCGTGSGEYGDHSIGIELVKAGLGVGDLRFPCSNYFEGAIVFLGHRYFGGAQN